MITVQRYKLAGIRVPIDHAAKPVIVLLLVIGVQIFGGSKDTSTPSSNGPKWSRESSITGRPARNVSVHSE